MALFRGEEMSVYAVAAQLQVSVPVHAFAVQRPVVQLLWRELLAERTHVILVPRLTVYSRWTKEKHEAHI